MEKDLLNDENKRVEEEVVDNTDYIEAIKDLKQNSVERSKYDNLKAENKKLLNALVNGQEVKVEGKQEVDIKKLREQTFYNENQTDLEYITNVLNLRKALIEKGEVDPFVPNGRKIAPTDADIAAAERVANGLQEMVDIADGNNTVFLNEYQRNVGDIALPKRKK